ncbi:uncharacterized protein [Triticum aestivum]|uniref:uncharacterized protein n=1 Tax=Triticum aestivum TaxID=4565 RepID=UPI001D02CA7B|nr:uncharacterized protein LOC123189942 [Triticum aestivum]XP_044458414.1 uncharacterized protein LOC123189942 [Triticum aestivum]XP_044458423.1 uncharacterized protein LOC123189942 [Triticum aestivum]
MEQSKIIDMLETYQYAGRLYHTFKEACSTRGLLRDDNEWYIAFDEAVVWGFGHRLRELFVTMLMHCSIRDEMGFFERYCVSMYDDIQHRLRHALGNPNYVVPPERLRNMLLNELVDIFLKHGSDIRSFNLPSRSSEGEQSDDNRLIREELSYDACALSKQSLVMFASLNEDQLVAYKTIVECVKAGKSGFFVSGYGGTGKTYLWSAICDFLRGERKIVLTVASSGIASLLLPGGRTAHSRFKIPILLEDNTQCDIKRGSKLYKLLMVSSLVIWDEALMTHRKCFEAVDRTLCDVLSVANPDLADIPFG